MRDVDGDSAGNFSVQQDFCDNCPTGWVPDFFDQDCYDNNANAHFFQTSFFTVNRGDGSFDYNCDNTIDAQFQASSGAAGDNVCQNINGTKPTSCASCDFFSPVSATSADCGQNRCGYFTGVTAKIECQ
jgi:hypothetical protein